MATTLIHNGLIHDAVHCEAYVADILLADGKIAAIGGGLTAPADAAVFDADQFGREFEVFYSALWTRIPI